MWDSQENLSEFDRFLIKTNKIGAKSLDELFLKERMITNKKALELIKNPIKANFDYQHLKDIHKALFEDVYTWAGQDRNEQGIYGLFIKGNSLFCKGEYLPKEAKRIFDELVKNNYLKHSKDLNNFAKELANFISDLNALHPFREGNGRTQRIFLNNLAKNAGYKLDLNLISKEQTIKASIEAMECHNQRLEILIKKNLKSFRQNLDLE
ncbi:cell filamentation protein Fic [Helicobacter valdiviensis]|uniref:protein adenylyltransferase n=1 Tax=Helicobacter valdiviensis TaxID=1458358 RepID=A0A2W6NJ88_9HELI|nr:Fic family protein [Helicobacter valdiviensis]PZT47426.1 cell filamentation protein Fic [Helicobacter valdiviensis]